MTLRRKPFNHNALTNVLRSGALSIADLERYASSNRAVDWAVTIVGTGGTSPVLAAGSVEAWYVAQNNVFHGFFSFNFQPGTTYGTATQWYLQLPVTIQASKASFPLYLGGAAIFDSSAAYASVGWCGAQHASGQTSLASLQSIYAENTPVTATPVNAAGLGSGTPWTWANGDQISGEIFGRIVDGFNA